MSRGTKLEALSVDVMGGDFYRAPGTPVALSSPYARTASHWLSRGDSTAIDQVGFGSATTGTATARAVTAAVNLFQAQRRLGFVSAAGAGSTAGVRSNLAQLFRSSIAAAGGFVYVCRFGMSLLSGGNNRAFVGLRTGAGVYGNFEPSASLDCVFMAFDIGDATWRIMHNDGAGACTEVDLGANFPAPGTVNQDFYELVLASPQGVSQNITYAVRRLDTGAVASGELSSNLPTNDVLMGTQVWVNNGATAAAVAIDVLYQYLEVPIS